MTEDKNYAQQNKALRVVMDRYGIRVIEGQERNLQKIPEDFSYQERGQYPVVEVRMGEQSTFCRFEDLGGAAFFGKERWLLRFPDWECYLLATILSENLEVDWYQQNSGIQGWIHAYGDFGSRNKDYHEWDYACRAAIDLGKLFGEAILGELLAAHKQYCWDTDGL